MSNLPQGISNRIEAEALRYAKAIPNCAPHIAYRSGATEWAEKAQGLVGALEKIVHHNFPADNEILKIAGEALAKYKEVIK